MRKRFEQLINLLADKECLICGGEYPDGCICEAKGKRPQWYSEEVLIGTVLWKIEKGEQYGYLSHADSLLRKWQPFGFTRPLQDISWREVRLNNGIIHQPKTKIETDLLLFLFSTFNL